MSYGEIVGLTGQTLYRYELDFGQIRLLGFEVLKETPCAMHILDRDDRPRIVRKVDPGQPQEARYAYLLKEKALESFEIRQEKKIKILTERINLARMAIQTVEEDGDALLEMEAPTAIKIHGPLELAGWTK